MLGVGEAQWSLNQIGYAAADSICDPVQQYVGYFELDSPLDKHYFHWFFESRNDPVNDPIILWMTGGPGCSSEVALFGENGPCTISADGTTTIRNEYSWNSNASVIYIDQPAGTGFSYGIGIDFTEDMVSNDMYLFLQKFLKAHPQYQSNPFFAFGESYAGHYIPATTHKIWSNNNNLKPGDVHINLKGTSVGNGLTAPAIQYAHYAEMAVSTNNHEPAVGKAEHAIMEAATPVCVAAILECQHNRTTCVVATDICNLGLVEPYALSGRNVYDMRIPCEKPPLCYDFSNVGVYLDSPQVRSYLGVGNRKWSDCNKLVNLEFQLAGDGLQSYADQIPDQLAAGIRVLIYAGDQDYICNWKGNHAWTNQLQWPHKREFNGAVLKDFSVDGKSAGTIQHANGFTFLRVYDAGHMVPRDQPKAALEMVNRFIFNSLN